MEGKFFRYIKGYLHIFIDSPLPERFLNLCAFHKIALWGLLPKEDGYEMFLSVRDFFRLRPIVRKTNTKIQVIGRYGMPFFFQKYKARKVFPISILISMGFIYLLTLFVWQIEVTGLEIHEKEEIVTFLYENNIQYGMFKGKVDCEEIESRIRAEYNDIVWVGASLEGTNLHIQIKENTESYQEEQLIKAASDIVATKSGVVVNIITRSGTPMVKEGQQVEAGQVLISGREERKDDSLTVVGYVEGYADGDVEIQSVNPYEDSFPYSHEEKVYTGKKKTKLTVWFFKKETTLWNSSRSIFTKKEQLFDKYDTKEKKATVVIGSSFFLPISYEKIQYLEYESVDKMYSKEEAKQLANKNYKKYQEGIIDCGGEIIDNSLQIFLEHDRCITKGNVTIVEPAATHAPLQPVEAFEEARQLMSEAPQ